MKIAEKCRDWTSRNQIKLDNIGGSDIHSLSVGWVVGFSGVIAIKILASLLAFVF